jgi:hypothetical protein
MKIKTTIDPLDPLRQFREAVYPILNPSRDAAFETIDAIASSRDARSAVEVSLSPTMGGKFSSVYKGVERTRIDEEKLRPLLVRQAESFGPLLFHGRALYALDHSPYPRLSAETVSDADRRRRGADPGTQRAFELARDRLGRCRVCDGECWFV